MASDHSPIVAMLPGMDGTRVLYGRPARRAFAIDVLCCQHCGGVRRLLAAIMDPAAIERMLRAIGLPCGVTQSAPSRAPQGDEEWWGA